MRVEKKAILDEYLVLRCQRGQEEAWVELVGRWESKLFYFIRRLVGDEHDAAQILQETWLNVVRGIRKLRQPNRLPIWLYRIARNTAMGHQRSEYTRAEVAGQEGLINEAQYEKDSVWLDNAEQVHFGLSRISLLHREVLTLFFLEDFSIDEIAEVLCVSPGTVKSRLFYAKKSLCQILEGANDA